MSPIHSTCARCVWPKTMASASGKRRASRRAMQMLTANGLVVGSNEAKGVKKVLDAAALTYVAALAQALSTLLYYVFLLMGLSRDE